MYILFISPVCARSTALYRNAADAYLSKSYGERDAGFDLFSEGCTLGGGARGAKIRQNLRAALYDTERGIFRAYWMLPRSSISKTTMRLANSVGLIDAGYRGQIMAAVDTDIPTQVEFGERYFQLSAPDLLAFDRIEIVEEIPGGPTLRGEGGFGSTGLGQ